MDNNQKMEILSLKEIKSKNIIWAYSPYLTQSNIEKSIGKIEQIISFDAKSNKVEVVTNTGNHIVNIRTVISTKLWLNYCMEQYKIKGNKQGIKLNKESIFIHSRKLMSIKTEQTKGNENDNKRKSNSNKPKKPQWNTEIVQIVPMNQRNVNNDRSSRSADF